MEKIKFDDWCDDFKKNIEEPIGEHLKEFSLDQIRGLQDALKLLEESLLKHKKSE